jgi:hypothetical protein
MDDSGVDWGRSYLKGSFLFVRLENVPIIFFIKLIIFQKNRVTVCSSIRLYGFLYNI